MIALALPLLLSSTSEMMAGKSLPDPWIRIDLSSHDALSHSKHSSGSRNGNYFYYIHTTDTNVCGEYSYIEIYFICILSGLFPYLDRHHLPDVL